MSKELEDAAAYLKWQKEKARLNELAEKAARRTVKKGQVYWCEFGLNVGCEISKTTPRPAIIFQESTSARTSSNTIVIPITHRGKSIPSLVSIGEIRNFDGTLILDGNADTSGIMCVSKARLGDLITELSDAVVKEIEASILTTLGIKKA